jgi:AcrR family transcriptional regulator
MSARAVAQKAQKAQPELSTDSPAPEPVIADILAVATREFAQHGLAGARIERIQQQTRTSKRMIYYHFGSKEGLYRAVLEHAFEAARQVDQGFDSEAGTPQQALQKIASNAFEAFVQHPEFVRLLSFENLAGAPFIRESEQVSRFNRRALAELQTVLARGQRDGSVRLGVQPIDVYINLVGLCFYHVAHHAAYLGAGFERQEKPTIDSQKFQQQRKLAIQEACWRYVKSGD